MDDPDAATDPTATEHLVETPHGPARLHRHDPDGPPRGTLLLGHGAGGSITAPDLQAVTGAATRAGFTVVLAEQPYRVAGRRAPAPAKQLDAAWLAIAASLAGAPTPLITGGRSSGARVACRTAHATGAAAVLCLAFPLTTPKGASRQDELDDSGVPILVVQGRTDRFGMPEPDPDRRRDVAQVDGDHGLKRDPTSIAAAVVDWLETITGEPRRPGPHDRDG